MANETSIFEPSAFRWFILLVGFRLRPKQAWPIYFGSTERLSMGNAKLSGAILLLICLLIDPSYAASSQHQHKSKTKQTTSKKQSPRHSASKHTYARHGSARHHRANKSQGPTVEQVPEEIFPPGHKFTPEERAEASEIGALVQNGMWKEAFKTSSKAAKVHPERWWLQAARAAAASNLNRPKDAIEAVDAALKTNAGDANRLNLAQLYTLRANALSRLGRKSEALSDFQSAIKFSKTDPVCRAGAAWLYATSADSQIRNGASAVALSTEAAKLSAWKDDTVLDVLAAAYAEAGDFRSAQKWEEKAILLGSPQDVPYYQHRLLNYQAVKPWR
jgi:Flp pilus assembly protein TadD